MSKVETFQAALVQLRKDRFLMETEAAKAGASGSWSVELTLASIDCLILQIKDELIRLVQNEGE